MQEQAKTLRRVGRGGLNEDAGPSAEAEAALSNLEGTGHRSATVAGTEIIRQPSEAEQVLRLLATQLRTMRALPASSGETPHIPGHPCMRHRSRYCSNPYCLAEH